MNAKQAVKLGGFLAILAVCVALLSSLFTPVWDSWNEDAMVAGFYEQPNDTIEVAFLGPSTTANGVSTIDMFQDFGLCSYSFGSGHEPLVSLYYWMKEAMRLHGNSLKVVVIDPSVLFYTKAETNNTAFAEKATAHMSFSPVKVEALWEYDKHYSGFSFFENLIPVFRYHSRWQSLSSNDYDYFMGHKGLYTGSHGQNVTFDVSAGNTDDQRLFVPVGGITDKKEKSTKELQSECQDYNLEMIDRFIEYCEQNNLQLVFVSMPHMNWSDERHDMVQAIADEHGLLFADLNKQDVYEQVGLYPPLDFYDHNHVNAVGARKVTRYIGQFFADNGIVGESKNNARYDFMADDVNDYNDAMAGSEFARCQSFEDYISLCSNERYAILIASKGDASKGLDATARKALRKLGLKKLADEKDVSSYAAIIDGGTVLLEDISTDEAQGASVKCSYYKGKIDTTGKQSVSGSNPRSIVAMSKAKNDGGSAAMKYEGGDNICENKEGLNFAVIDKELDTVVDTSCFNTCDDSSRTTDLVPSSYEKRLKKALEGEA